MLCMGRTATDPATFVIPLPEDPLSFPMGNWLTDYNFIVNCPLIETYFVV